MMLVSAVQMPNGVPVARRRPYCLIFPCLKYKRNVSKLPQQQLALVCLRKLGGAVLQLHVQTAHPELLRMFAHVLSACWAITTHLHVQGRLSRIVGRVKMLWKNNVNLYCKLILLLNAQRFCFAQQSTILIVVKLLQIHQKFSQSYCEHHHFKSSSAFWYWLKQRNYLKALSLTDIEAKLYKTWDLNLAEFPYIFPRGRIILKAL